MACRYRDGVTTPPRQMIDDFSMTTHQEARGSGPETRGISPITTSSLYGQYTRRSRSLSKAGKQHSFRFTQAYLLTVSTVVAVLKSDSDFIF